MVRGGVWLGEPAGGSFCLFRSPGVAHNQPDAAALHLHRKPAVGIERARDKRDRAPWRVLKRFPVP